MRQGREGPDLELELEATSNVVKLDDRRPHVVIESQEFDGTIHVVPVCLVERWIRGDLSVRPPTSAMLKAIMRDWLEEIL